MVSQHYQSSISNSKLLFLCNCAPDNWPAHPCALVQINCSDLCSPRCRAAGPHTGEPAENEASGGLKGVWDSMFTFFLLASLALWARGENEDIHVLLRS